MPYSRRPLTLLELVDLPFNLPRRGRKDFNDRDAWSRKQQRRKTPTILPEDKIYLYLHALSTPSTWMKLGAEWGVSATQVANVFYHVQDHVLRVLHDGPDATVVWPTPEQRAEAAQKLVGLPGCFGYMDGESQW